MAQEATVSTKISAFFRRYLFFGLASSPHTITFTAIQCGSKHHPHHGVQCVVLRIKGRRVHLTAQNNSAETNCHFRVNRGRRHTSFLGFSRLLGLFLRRYRCKNNFASVQKITVKEMTFHKKSAILKNIERGRTQSNEKRNHALRLVYQGN